MKFVCVILASALFVSAGVSGERCKVFHTTNSSLKCGDRVFSRDAATIAAFNECTKDEDYYKLDASFCILDKLGALTNGSITPSKLEELLSPSFQELAPALVAGFVKCYQDQNFIFADAKHLPSETAPKNTFNDLIALLFDPGISAANAANYQHEPIECSAQVYEDVCGHKTCDGINML